MTSSERNLPLLLLAILASVYTLHWAGAVIIPLLVGMLFSYALSPLVNWLQQHRIPRVLSAALLVLGIVLGVAFGVYSLSDEASKLVELLPQAAQKINQMAHTIQGGGDSTLTTVQKAAAKLEQAAADSTQTTGAGAPLSRGVQRVVVEKPHFDIKDYFWSGTIGLMQTLGQASVVALITFFLLASGDNFRRKVIKLVGPTLHAKRITLQALDQIHDQIQRYLLVQLFTSVVVGVLTWLCFLALGLENAAVWGVAAGLLDLVPYVGNVVIAGAAALVSFLQFGTLEMALLVSGASLAIHSLESFLLTPWLASRTSRMNPLAIFVGVLAWGWLWGIFGLLLGVPILVVIKTVCDRVEGLAFIGEMLGD